MEDIMTIRSKPRWSELAELAMGWLAAVKLVSREDQESKEFSADYADACMTHFPAPTLDEFWSQWPDWQPRDYDLYNWAGPGFTRKNDESADNANSDV